MPTIPTTMHAAAIDEFGGPDFLKLHTLPVPAPAAREVPIAGTYSLASAAKAPERIEEGHVLGKIVIRIGETEL